MKSLILKSVPILIALSAAIAPLAASADTIPQTATIQFQTSANSGGWVEDDHGAQCNPTNQILGAWKDQAAQQTDIDFKCQTVYRDWDVNDVRVGSSHNTSITVTTYCEPRSLQQQQILSLEKACQTQPSEQCYSKDFLSYLGKLKNTRYVDINKPTCD